MPMLVTKGNWCQYSCMPGYNTSPRIETHLLNLTSDETALALRALAYYLDDLVQPGDTDMATMQNRALSMLAFSGDESYGAIKNQGLNIDDAPPELAEIITEHIALADILLRYSFSSEAYLYMADGHLQDMLHALRYFNSAGVRRPGRAMQAQGAEDMPLGLSEAELTSVAAGSEALFAYLHEVNKTATERMRQPPTTNPGGH